MGNEAKLGSSKFSLKAMWNCQKFLLRDKDVGYAL